MAKKHLTLKPQQVINDKIWFYEETDGADIYIRAERGRIRNEKQNRTFTMV